jgi:hypothetical protein
MIVLGNGESRRNLDIAAIDEHVIGCNAVVRDFDVDYVVCCDKRMVKEALLTDVKKIYTRKRWFFGWGDSRVVELPDIPYKGSNRQDEAIHWGSGPYAVLLAAKDASTVYMAGFDLYGNDKYLNNIYKDTANYKASTDLRVDPSYWIYQIGKVFELYPRRDFVILQPADWVLPKEWQHDNVKVDNKMYYKYNTL